MAEITVYCTKDDVQRWVKRVQFSDTTKVTPSDIDSYIQTVSGIVDGKLRKIGIALPISSSCKISMGILKTLVSYEVASLAEQTVFFGANKNEASHGIWLHNQYIALLEQIQNNPCMLSDVVITGSTGYMRSSTEDMNEGGAKEGEEIFTKKHIDDFKVDHKVLSPSELDSPEGTITGQVDRTRV
jgi:hypothetical protein